MKLIELRQKILLIRLDGQYWSLNGKKIVLHAAVNLKGIITP